MSLKEQFQLINDVCSSYRGNLKEHQLIQEALRTVKEKVLDESLVVEEKEK